jgi:arabinogalactan endo-1,4-beta-galactosidase
MRSRGIGLIFFAVLVGVAAAGSFAEPTTQPASFLLGADISNLSGGFGGFRGASTRATTQAARGPRRAAIYQENGKVGTELGIMMNHGWNAFRLRVFVDPVHDAPNNTLANTIVLAKQIKAAGATFLLDIHYSDTWADPQHQETPMAWQELDADGLEKKVEQYSADVITQLKGAGAMPDMVQVGNEITGGMLWPLGHVKVPHSDVKIYSGVIQPLPDPYDDQKQWSNLIRFIKAGVRGVRAASGDSPVKIVIHIDCGGDWPVTKWYFDHLTAAQVDYDVIGQSFYPSTHGTPDELQQNMVECNRAYHKPFMVAETGYGKMGGDQLMARGKYNLWPGTPAGQLQFMVDLVNTVRRQPNGMAVFYWAPERAMWNGDGSPAPAISVLDHLTTLTTRPSSHLPDAP